MARPRKVKNPEELKIALEHFEECGSIEFKTILRTRKYCWTEEAEMFLQQLEQVVGELRAPPPKQGLDTVLAQIRPGYRAIRALIRQNDETRAFEQALWICGQLDRFTKEWDCRRGVWQESSYVLRPCGTSMRWDPEVWKFNKEDRDYELPGSWSRRARERLQQRY